MAEKQKDQQQEGPYESDSGYIEFKAQTDSVEDLRKNIREGIVNLFVNKKFTDEQIQVNKDPKVENQYTVRVNFGEKNDKQNASKERVAETPDDKNKLSSEQSHDEHEPRNHVNLNHGRVRNSEDFGTWLSDGIKKTYVWQNAEDLAKEGLTVAAGAAIGALPGINWIFPVVGGIAGWIAYRQYTKKDSSKDSSGHPH